MTYKTFLLIGMAATVCTVACGQNKESRWNTPTGYRDTPQLPNQKWKVHDIDRPKPPVITPGAQPGMPPSDAIVLFDGKDVSKWETRDRKTRQMVPAKWTVENGYMYAKTGSGDLVSKEKFGDCQIHIEWAAPTEFDGDSQWRGNSGVLIMNRYEIQVLDSYNNPTYADGQAASIYGQWPPFVNASRKPGEWQAYDIIFEAPKWEGEKMVKPPFVTVIHNGVVMHHRQEIIGPMAHKVVAPFRPHTAEEPLGLQDHDTRTRFRNVWVRRLKGYDQP